MKILLEILTFYSDLLMIRMKFFAFVALFVISAQGKTIVRSVKNCGKLKKVWKARFFFKKIFLDGFEDAALVAVSGSTPDEIPIPGEVTMDLYSKITQDLPEDLVIKLDLQKQEPFPLDVPCLDGLGSW